MNKIMLIGRLTRDAEVRHSANNDNMPIARYTLAVKRPVKQNGEQEADFINCVAFGKNAELAEKYLFKSMKIAVEGHIQTGSYTNRDGQRIYTTDVVVERQEFLERRADNGQPNHNAAGSHGDGYMNIPDGIDEDLPFN